MAENLAFLRTTYDLRAVQRSALCRFRRELSIEYLLAKIGFDTAENEPCKVCRPVLRLMHPAPVLPWLRSDAARQTRDRLGLAIRRRSPA